MSTVLLEPVRTRYLINLNSYLQYPDPVIREVVIEIRISCHALPIEQGRYNNVRTNKKNYYAIFANMKWA